LSLVQKQPRLSHPDWDNGNDGPVHTCVGSTRLDLGNAVCGGLALGISMNNYDIEIWIESQYTSKPFGDLLARRALQSAEIWRNDIEIDALLSRKSGNMPTQWLVGRAISEKERSGWYQLARESCDPTGFVR
jgi:hypothetical protein